MTAVLAGMLRAFDRAKNPDAEPDRPVALRGFSWIVNPFETGGVVIALEMTIGAVVAGPFDVTESALSGLIERAMAADRAATVGSSRSSSLVGDRGIGDQEVGETTAGVEPPAAVGQKTRGTFSLRRKSKAGMRVSREEGDGRPTGS